MRWWGLVMVGLLGAPVGATAGEGHAPRAPALARFKPLAYEALLDRAAAAAAAGQWVAVPCTFAGTDLSFERTPGDARAAGIATADDAFFRINRPDAPPGETKKNSLGFALPVGFAGAYWPAGSPVPDALAVGQRVTVYGLVQPLPEGGVVLRVTSVVPTP